jgi:2'-5' RNA ligase
MDGPTTRLFLALWPGPAVRDALRACRDAWTWPRAAAPVASAKLHLTLHFLGDQPSERLPDLLDGLAVPCMPFRLDLGTPKLWPHGIAVLEPFAEPDELLELHANLSGALVALGLVPEARRYRPHVTMARRAANAIAPASQAPLAWDIAGYVLVESRGGSYSVLRQYA